VSYQEKVANKAVIVLRRHQRQQFPEGIPCAMERIDLYAEDGSPIYDEAPDFSSIFSDDDRGYELLPMDQRLETFSAKDLGIK
jgi:hypothetical protein